MTIEQFSEQTLAGFQERVKSRDGHETVSFDPISLAILMGIIGGVVSHYCEKCLNAIDRNVDGLIHPDGVKAIYSIQNPNWIQRQALRYMLSSEMKAKLPQYSRYSDELANQLIEQAKSASPESITNLSNGLRR